MKKERNHFASKVGLIAATVGSAVGLGNVWRFPAETQANGGAAFLLVYIACVFILGVPVMVTEMAIGRAGGSDAVGAFKNLGAKRGWWAVGGLAILASYLILCFYMVVAGWTFEYFWQSMSGTLYAPVPGAESLNGQFAARMKEFITQGWNPLLNTYIMIGVTLTVLIVGVQKGSERVSNVLMPILFLILVVFCGVSMTLPGAEEGMEFFLKPDFSKINGGVILNALGQAFFSLSLGMGIIITYSSYYPKDTKLTRTAITVSSLDLLVALLMGFIIFPAVMSFGLQGEGLEGPTLVFVTLPEVFAQMPGTAVWSALFFLLLLVAALTSCISIAEVTVAFFQDRLKLSRRWASCLVMLPLLIFSTLCSLSQGVLSDFKILGLNIFDLLDTVATNIMLPLGSIFLCVYMGWFAPKGLFRNELSNNGTVKLRIYRAVYFIVRWIAPILIAMVLVSSFIK
ncbi:MAG: sodium-dependent transporter [Bacteroidales bacterium]|nr:sodium-dependent transporter [Bacteroidales bacterium]